MIFAPLVDEECVEGMCVCPQHVFMYQLQLGETQRIIQERTRRGERELEEVQQSLESLKVSTRAHVHRR